MALLPLGFLLVVDFDIKDSGRCMPGMSKIASSEPLHTPNPQRVEAPPGLLSGSVSDSDHHAATPHKRIPDVSVLMSDGAPWVRFCAY